MPCEVRVGWDDDDERAPAYMCVVYVFIVSRSSSTQHTSERWQTQKCANGMCVRENLLGEYGEGNSVDFILTNWSGGTASCIRTDNACAPPLTYARTSHTRRTARPHPLSLGPKMCVFFFSTDNLLFTDFWLSFLRRSSSMLCDALIDAHPILLLLSLSSLYIACWLWDTNLVGNISMLLLTSWLL